MEKLEEILKAEEGARHAVADARERAEEGVRSAQAEVRAQVETERRAALAEAASLRESIISQAERQAEELGTERDNTPDAAVEAARERLKDAVHAALGELTE